MNQGLSLDGVTLVRDGSPLLNSVDWNVLSGQHWAVLGQNGSGKTLLLRIVSGYLWPTKGAVSVLGKKFGSFDLRTLRKQIGWVSLALQFEIPPAATAVEVVQSGYFASLGLYEVLKTSQVEHAGSLLKEFGCEGLSERSFGTLSYGEQKRVLLARALVHDPKLLILDEPCTGLDLKARESLLKTLSDLVSTRNDLTLIYVTHHIEEIMPFMSHVLMMRKGKVLFQGEKGEAINSERVSSCFDIKAKVMPPMNGRFWLQWE